MKGGRDQEHLDKPSGVKNVDEYKYLGQIIIFGNTMNKEIEQKITNAWKTFWSLKSVFKSKMNIANKIKMLNRIVSRF